MIPMDIMVLIIVLGFAGAAMLILDSIDNDG